MKKYKLIKTYPGSPELGYMIEGDEFESDSTFSVIECHKHPEYWQEIVEDKLEIPLKTKFKYKSASTLYIVDSIDEDNDVKITWENGTLINTGYAIYSISRVNENFKNGTWVVEKDYEILSLISDKGNLAKYDEPTELYPNPLCNNYKTREYWLQCFLRYKHWKIHSVKRLSDGEIFTIGDKVYLTNGNYFTSELKEFKFFHNGECGHLEKHRNGIFLKLGISSVHSGKEIHFFYLEDIVKATCKKPLFTTEDGVDIFEGDKFYYVNNGYIIEPRKAIIEKDFNPFAGKRDFSSIKTAEKYIEENKPCLSYNDIITGVLDLTLCDRLGKTNKSNIKKLLKVLVKNRLKCKK